MKRSVLCACALALAIGVSARAAGPAAAALPVVTYAPPAKNMPTGRLHGLTYDAVLPSGRLVTPAGTSVVTGTGALGLALTPDGRFAVVGNDDQRGTGTTRSAIDPAVTDGASLAVVDTTSLTVVSRYTPPAGERYYGGIVAVADPAEPGGTLVLAAGGSSDAVFAFTLDADGRLTPDPRHRIAIPGPADPAFADRGRSAPAALVLSPDGRRAYVVDAAGGSVAAIDLATRRLLGAPRPVGYFPSDAAIAGGRLIVTNEGMMRYALMPQAAAAPPFGTPAPALARASSLSLVDLSIRGALVPPALDTAGPATVPMDQPADGWRIVGGAHPSAIAVRPDGAYAFVAMTNVDRIATVALGATPHVAGGTELRLFDRGPYGTQPRALALSRDGSRLYVALRGLDAIAVIDARDPLHLHRLGLIPTGWAPSALALAADDRTLFIINERGFGSDGGAVWSTLQRVDLASVRLAESTRATLAATHTTVTTDPSYPKAIKNVVVVAVDAQSNAGAFGAGVAATPNLHALAARFALAGNFYADADDPAIAHQVLVSGLATAFGEMTSTLDEPVFASVDDPEDAPRIGSVFQAFARRGTAFRDYGGFLQVAGATGGAYTYDVPAAAALAGHVDLDYPAADPAVTNTQRADAFARDYDAQIASVGIPHFAYVWLPGGSLADTDAAIGRIVEHLSHLASWRTSAVLVVGDASAAPDPVDPAHTYALVISPFAKRHVVGMKHLSTASVLKTVDGIFDFPPFSLGDLLASGMNDLFTPVADARPFTALPAEQP